MKYLVLFDIDGTILSLKDNLAKELFTRFLQELFGQDIPNDKIPSFAGMTDLQILKDITKSINIPEELMMQNLNKIWSNIFGLFRKHITKENVTILEGAKVLISDLHIDPNIQLGLVTGNFADNAYLKLETHDLSDFFPFGAFGDDDADRNLLPLIAIDRANEFIGMKCFNTNNTVIIGDTHRDIECGKINNIPVISVASGQFTFENLELHSPELLLNDLSDTERIKKFIYNL